MERNSTRRMHDMNEELKPKKILIADFTLAKYKELETLLKKDAVEITTVSDPAKFQRLLQKNRYEMCLVNLLFGGVGPRELMTSIRKQTKHEDMKVVFVSRQVQRVNIENCIKAGAVDFVADPFESEVLVQRVLYHLSPKQIVDTDGFEDQPFDKVDWNAVRLLVDGIELLSKSSKNQERPAFFKILQDLATFIGSNRTSLIIVDTESNSGIVHASSDDASFVDYPISLKDYPEILHVVNTGSVVLIDDITRNIMTRRIKENVKSIEIGSVMVFPIRYQNEIRGVLTIRRAKATDLPAVEVLRLIHALANTMAAHSNVHAMLRKIYRDFHGKAS